MTTPPTFVERARKLSESDRLQYLKARELLEDLEELKDAAQTYIDKDATDVLEALGEAVEALNALSLLGLTFPVDTQEAAGWVNNLSEQLPSTDQMQEFLDAHEQLEQALEEMQEHRDDPSGSTRDEKEYARDEARNALEGVADALEALDTPGNA